MKYAAIAWNNFDSHNGMLVYSDRAGIKQSNSAILAELVKKHIET